MKRLDFVLIQKPWVFNEGRISSLRSCPGNLVSCSSQASSAGANDLLQEERVGMRRKRKDWGSSNINTRG
nr:unnamed protein product [Callosobruchus analis]